MRRWKGWEVVVLKFFPQHRSAHLTISRTDFSLFSVRGGRVWADSAPTLLKLRQ